jgi:hypothetical protein
MSLVEIKQHLMKVKMASLASLCAYFKTDSDLLRQMLGHWIRKGCVRQCMKTAACGRTCMKCSVPAVEIYEWVNIQ